jgi:TPR repeat protein
MRMALTFDAAFLKRAGMHGLPGDPERAAFWYQRARELDEVNAERASAPSNEPPSQPR